MKKLTIVSLLFTVCTANVNATHFHLADIAQPKPASAHLPIYQYISPIIHDQPKNAITLRPKIGQGSFAFANNVVKFAVQPPKQLPFHLVTQMEEIELVFDPEFNLEFNYAQPMQKLLDTAKTLNPEPLAAFGNLQYKQPEPTDLLLSLPCLPQIQQISESIMDDILLTSEQDPWLKDVCHELLEGTPFMRDQSEQMARGFNCIRNDKLQNEFQLTISE